MIAVRLRGGDALAARLAALPVAARDGIGRAMLRLATQLQRTIRDEKLSGQVLAARSGALRAGIDYRIAAGGDAVTVTIGSAVRYARFHEFGTRASYPIRPRTARTLAFAGKGETRFARRVTHPPLRERSFLRAAAAEFGPTIAAGLAAALEEALPR